MIPGMSLNIALYLFLGGMGAGLYAAWFVKRAWQHTSRCNSWNESRPSRFERRPDATVFDSPIEQLAAVAIVLCGCLFLLMDLGVARRFFYVFLKPFSSIISLGAWSILLFTLFAMARYMAYQHEKLRFAAPLLSVCAFVFALVTCAYTGFYLYSLGSAMPLWASPLVILVFFASAIGTGCDASLALGTFFNPLSEDMSLDLSRTSTLETLAKTIEGLALALFLAMAVLGGSAARDLALQLLAGPWAVRFWLLAAGFGIIAPIAARIASNFSEIREVPAILSAVCGMVGGLALRCCIIFV